MEIDKRVVANNYGLVRFDKTDAAHVRGETVDLVDAFSRFQTAVSVREVQQLKLMCGGWFVFRFLNINATNPVTAVDEILS